MKTIYTLILGVIFFTFSQAQTFDLKLNLEKGETYQQIIHSKATIKQEVYGRDINIIMTIKGALSFMVQDATPEAYSMQARFTQLAMNMQTPQGEMAFNSEKDDSNDIFSTILRSMKDKTFNLTMSKNGKITDIDKIDKLWEKAINDVEDIPQMQKDQIKSQILKAYGPDALKGNIEMVTAIYPDNPVKLGDKWTTKTNLETGMSANMTTEYEFFELTSNYAIIKGNSKIKTADKDAYIENNGMKMKYDMTGTMVSDIKVDKNTGWIEEAKIDQELIGDAFIKKNPQLPDGMKIPMRMKSELIITDN